MSGLLSAEEGYILIDNVQLDESNFFAWRGNIGYAPQSTFLLDSTVRENIAFGKDPEEIDDAKIHHLAEITQITHLVESKGNIGEGGLRLSGGERQRIGIARALYEEPALLILDEATSAVDPETELKILAALRDLKSTTIIMITHRLASLDAHDMVYFMDQGRVEARGDYSELLATNALFRALTGDG